MADSTLVRYSGDWIFKSGIVAPGATLAVVTAGGADNDYANIYTDADLTTAASNPVTADSDGLMPFVWIGTDDYKIILKTSTGTTIKTQDNIPGATASGVAATTAIPIEEVNELTADTTLGTANIGQTLNCTPSTTFTVTLGSAVTIGDGNGFRIVHSGTSNQVNIVTSSGETIVRANKSTTAFALVSFGHAVKLISDGANWVVVSETQPGIVSNLKIIPVEDRISAAPSTPTSGTFYIVSSAFSTYSTGDLLEADGQEGFTVHTVPEGTLAWVNDEDIFYRYSGSAWVAESASDTVPGTLEIAVQSEMETATSTTLAVTPGRQQYHPGHPKFWLTATVTSGVPAITDSHNMTSVTDSGQGDLTGTVATDFSSTGWCLLPGLVSGSGLPISAKAAPTTGTFELVTRQLNGSAVDPDAWFAAGLGDQ